MSVAIAPKLQALIRLLSSDRDGEVIAAVRALARTLQGAKLDFHWLADNVSQANGKKFTEADALEIYQRGGEAGRREVEKDIKFRDVDASDEPSWHEIACECSRYSDRLRGDREKQFVSDMVRRTVHGGKLSEKQAAWLRSIYTRVR